jgi:hypothetical protein
VLTTDSKISGGFFSPSHILYKKSGKEGTSWCPPSGVATSLDGVATSFGPVVTIAPIGEIAIAREKVFETEFYQSNQALN